MSTEKHRYGLEHKRLQEPCAVRPAIASFLSSIPNCTSSQVPGLWQPRMPINMAFYLVHGSDAVLLLVNSAALVDSLDAEFLSMNFATTRLS